MIDRYPHAPECLLNSPAIQRFSGKNHCTCGATALQSAFEAGKREGLEEAAHWLDAEYAYLAAVSPRDTSDAASQGIGMRAECAELAALLRQWAAAGRPPEHRRVKEKKR
jgi:hypothetical protein